MVRNLLDILDAGLARGNIVKPAAPCASRIAHRNPSFMSSTSAARNALSDIERLLRRGDLAVARDRLRKLVDKNVATARAHELLALVAAQSRDPAGYETHLFAACRLPDCSPAALFQLGCLQLQRAQAQAAIATFKRVIQLVGDQFEPLHELGVAHSGLGEWPRALDAFTRAAARNGRSSSLQYNLGNALAALGRYDDALAAYDQALEIDPTFAMAWRDKGLALLDLHRGEDAARSLDRADELAPGAIETLLAKASVSRARGHDGDAAEAHRQLAALPPDPQYDRGYWIHGRLTNCHWECWPDAFGDVENRVRRGERAIVPFYLLHLPVSGATLRSGAHTFVQEQVETVAARPLAPRAPSGKIRVGYFSTDFHDHAVSQLLVGVLEHHDKQAFECHGFALNARTHDRMTERLSRAFDRFESVADATDAQITELARARGLDIAVDLNGCTAGARPGIFAGRAAPIQVNYLGYPGTMGCSFMDYIVADATVITSSDHDAFSEKVVTLPGSYLPNDDTKAIAPPTTSRADHGLPERGFVFACFNNPLRISPDVFDVWMRLLRDVEGSVLWLQANSQAPRISLMAEAERRGVDPGRLVWSTHVDYPLHLERHRHADLFVDTFHYNGHTSCTDALWAGLPVLTREGATFQSRVAAGLLRAAGLHDLATSSAADYERLAIDLATGRRDDLTAWRRHLAEKRSELPVFDTKRYAKNLESAFRLMAERHRQGLTADHIVVTE